MGPSYEPSGRPWEPGPRLRAALRGIIDLALPPAPLDGGALPQGPGLSAESWSRITFLEDPVCDGCGRPFAYDAAGPEAAVRCAGCLARPHRFERARAACLYDEASRNLVLAFKHGDRLELAGLFALWLARAAAPLLAEADAVVPIPLHRWRLLARRCNQAAEIARPLARRAGLPYLADALVRRRPTPSQGGRSARARRVNVRGAFAVPEARRRQVEGRRILLVDDVLTTGATADACARALLAAGAACVDLAVVARVRSGRDATI